MFLYEYIFENNRPSSEKLRCHFHFVFPVMPDKVAFVSVVFIWLQLLPGKPRYLPLQKRLLLAENEFAFASLWEKLCPSANINKSMLQGACSLNAFAKQARLISVSLTYFEPNQMTISQTNWNKPAYLVNLFNETGHRSVLMVLKF